MRPRGFTLLEVVVAVALLGVGLVAVVGLLNRSLELARQTLERREDVALAVEVAATLDLETRLREEEQRLIQQRYPGRRFRLETRPTQHRAVEKVELQVFRGEDREPAYRLVRFVESEVSQ